MRVFQAAGGVLWLWRLDERLLQGLGKKLIQRVSKGCETVIWSRQLQDDVSPAPGQINKEHSFYGLQRGRETRVSSGHCAHTGRVEK